MTVDYPISKAIENLLAAQPLGDRITVQVDGNIGDIDISNYKARGVVNEKMSDYGLARWLRKALGNAIIVKVLNRNAYANPPHQPPRDQELHEDQRADG